VIKKIPDRQPWGNCRTNRACVRRDGHSPVAILFDADRHALAVKRADEAHSSWCRTPGGYLIRASCESGSGNRFAMHCTDPGYGFSVGKC